MNRTLEKPKPESSASASRQKSQSRKKNRPPIRTANLTVMDVVNGFLVR